MVLPDVLVVLFRRHPRATAAIWFGLFGLGAASVMFLLPVLERSLADHILYLVLPSLSGALAGYFSGWQLLVAGTTRGPVRAVGRGMVVALEAFAIFSLLFTITYRLLGEQQPNPLAFFTSTLVLGVLATGPVVFSTGVIAAVLLHRLGRVS